MPTQNHLTHTDPEKSLDPTVDPHLFNEFKLTA